VHKPTTEMAKKSERHLIESEFDASAKTPTKYLMESLRHKAVLREASREIAKRRKGEEAKRVMKSRENEIGDRNACE
jgi:hypothetical protein